MGQLERVTTTSSAGGIKTALALDKEKPPRRIECGFANHILGTGRFLFEIFTLPLNFAADDLGGQQIVQDAERKESRKSA